MTHPMGSHLCPFHVARGCFTREWCDEKKNHGGLHRTSTGKVLEDRRMTGTGWPK